MTRNQSFCNLTLILCGALFVPPTSGERLPRCAGGFRTRRASRGTSVSIVNTTLAATTQHRRLADASITVHIQFDEWPSDISWDMIDLESSVEIAAVLSFDDSTFSRKAFEQPVNVTRGSSYQFRINDSWGDGFTDPGAYYAVFWGTDVTMRENLLLFSDSETFRDVRTASHVFIADQPATPAPTHIDEQPTVSPAPTHAPTSCVVGGLGTVRESTFDRTPNIKNTDSVFLTNAFCTSHSNYKDCTNESREDCQWIFLPSSRSNGMCRIDPMSKCLKTGDCVCYTEDFHGGRADYGNGIVFHAPISISPRDISQFAGHMTYQETYSTPAGNENSKHPHDEGFFISKVGDSIRKFLDLPLFSCGVAGWS